MNTFREKKDKVRMEMSMRVVPAAGALVEALRVAQLPIDGNTDLADKLDHLHNDAYLLSKRIMELNSEITQ